MKQPKLRPEDLKPFGAKTVNQQAVINHWNSDANLILNGSAGTGKTFLALALGLQAVLNPKTEYDRLIIIRSAVPTRDIGFLPGNLEEKTAVYQSPYATIINKLCNNRGAYELGLASGQIIFTTTSFTRGITLERAVIVVDEMQNFSGHELDSVMTRLGEDTRIFFCGDYHQSDFTNAKDRAGLADFLEVLETLSCFETISFTWADIVRSAIVREYICAKEQIASSRIGTATSPRPAFLGVSPDLSSRT